MITYIPEILDWAVFNKQEIRPCIRCSPTDSPSTRQDEHVEWIAIISEKMQHYTVALLRGSMLASGSTFINPVLSVSIYLSQYIYIYIIYMLYCPLHPCVLKPETNTNNRCERNRMGF